MLQEDQEIYEDFFSAFVVRRARKKDMENVRSLIATIFPKARNRIMPGDYFLIAEKNQIPIGFCHYRIRKKTCYIAGLGVLAHYREHGVGSKLLAEALYHIDKKGIQTTYLKVRATNYTAAKLYLHFGFFEKRAGDVILLVRKRAN
ncbi:MAG: GNAT family N-acetyltransferase [Candidatus Micrarchaeota archaeon]|nr:GNAT family N-acetyltransferase [Candidatus Micrarchaeota archaeon]